MLDRLFFLIGMIVADVPFLTMMIESVKEPVGVSMELIGPPILSHPRGLAHK